MKLFMNSDSIVCVQVSDLKFLLNRNKTPKIIKLIIKYQNLDDIDDNEYIMFMDKLMIKYMHQATFILDIDQFSRLSFEEIKEEIDKNNQRMDKVRNIKSNLLIHSKYLDKENHDKLNNYYQISMHYKKQLQQFEPYVKKVSKNLDYKM